MWDLCFAINKTRITLNGWMVRTAEALLLCRILAV